MTSGPKGSAEDGVRANHLHGEICPEEDAQKPLRGDPQGDGLDTTQGAHGDDPELNTLREGPSFATGQLSHADSKHPVHRLRKFRSNFCC